MLKEDNDELGDISSFWVVCGLMIEGAARSQQGERSMRLGREHRRKKRMGKVS